MSLSVLQPLTLKSISTKHPKGYLNFQNALGGYMMDEMRLVTFKEIFKAYLTYKGPYHLN